MNGRLARARAEVERLSRQVDRDHVDILTLEERLADAVAKRDQLAEAILIDRADADQLQRETEASLEQMADERNRLARQRDEWKAEYERVASGRSLVAMFAERDRLAGQVQRVRDLHAEQTIKGLAVDCAREKCSHEDECPEDTPYQVCGHCLEQFELADLYATEQSAVWGQIMWPCATVRALNDGDVILFEVAAERDRLGESPERRPGESMGEYGVRLGLRPGHGGQPIEAIGDGDDVDPRST